VVFTVKLPGWLAEQVREHARQREVTLSAVVARALAEFLRRNALGKRSGT
jgi:predicted transcriptional regulator